MALYMRLVALVWAIAAGGVAAMAFFGLSTGAAWIFVHGDDPWPDWYWPVQEAALILVGLLAAAFTWYALVRHLGRLGKVSRNSALRRTTLLLMGAFAAAGLFILRSI